MTALEEVITLLPPPEAKGLEFDAVVVVEPARFFADPDDTAGGRLLYIALTRAVQELALVHAEPLPAELSALQLGGRFSLKAAIPSAASSVDAVTVSSGWSIRNASSAAASHAP